MSNLTIPGNLYTPVMQLVNDHGYSVEDAIAKAAADAVRTRQERPQRDEGARREGEIPMNSGKHAIMGAVKYRNALGSGGTLRGLTWKVIAPMHDHSTSNTTEDTIEYKIDPETGAAIIPVRISRSSKTFEILVDVEDIPKVRGVDWYQSPSAHRAFGVQGSKNKKTVMLHRVITGQSAMSGYRLIARNGNDLDYRKDNIVYEAVRSQKRQRAIRLSGNEDSQHSAIDVDRKREYTNPDPMLLSHLSRAQQKSQGRSLSSNLRSRILDRDGGICFYCEYEANQVDHIIPYAYGGTDDEDNLIACCSICNQIASDKVFDTLREKRDFIRAKYGPWMERRLKKFMHQHSVCADCMDLYSPSAPGASNLLCPKCYAKS